jgi:hypothetical protein
MPRIPSELELFGLGVPPYAARGLTQTLEPIDQQAHLERAIDGSLLDLSYTPFQKYKSTISCTDQRAPVCDGVWAGQLVTVYCVAELCYNEYGAPSRPVVPGSERFEGGFHYYRKTSGAHRPAGRWTLRKIENVGA